MKKVSFMVALLAVIQILLGSRTALSQNLRLDQDRQDDRRTIEEALDVAGEDIGEELEQLLKQLDTTAGKIGQKFERWAEENAEELEAWSEKHGAEWEKFGERFGLTMESIAEDQEGIWSQWAKRYERDLKRWEEHLQQDELSAENIGRFVDDNLEALSRMPLGQLVDQALEDGIGELRKAPWDSLEELGLLAKDALQEPMDELAGLTIEGAKARRALDRGAREMGRSLRQLSEDLERNISDSDLNDLLDNEPAPEELLDQDPRVKRLKELLRREDINRQQRQSIEEMIDAIRSSDRRPTDRSRQAIDVPRRDQILEKIQREKKRHAQAIDEFNLDLRRSSEDSLQKQRQKRDIDWQKKDSRVPKRPDGRNLDLPPRSENAQQFKFFRDGDGRQPRTQKHNSRRASNQKSDGQPDQRDIQWIEDRNDKRNEKQTEAMESLLREVEKLRKEVESLKQNRS